MEADEPGSGEERERDEEEAGILAQPRLLADAEAERGVDGRDGEDDQEVSGVILSPHVEDRRRKQQPQQE